MMTKKLIPLTLLLLLAGCKLIPQPAAPQRGGTPAPIIIEVPLDPEGTLNQDHIFDSGTYLGVPTGSPPQIDGQITDSEWASADLYTIESKGKLYMMYADGYLYLGIRTLFPSETHLCLAYPDRITVLHAGLTLDTANFSYHDDGWWAQQPFSSCCQDSADDNARQLLLMYSGWNGSTASMGLPTDTEYQIAMPEGALTISLFNWTEEPDQYLFWPESMKGKCYFPDDSNAGLIAPFIPSTWITVVSEP